MYPSKTIIRVPQIARISDVSEEAVRQWCRSNWLKSHKTEDMRFGVYFEDLAEHFAFVPKHLDKLLDSEPESKLDQELKRRLINEIWSLKKTQSRRS